MTQLELPPISIARYLDLLKRRRWQVVPVTVLGLLVGFLVAFFIPRYYVARTEFQIQGSLFANSGGGDDPLAPLVDGAQSAIPATVDEAIEELGWREASISDPDERRAKEREIRQRVTVIDANPRRGRTVATLVIQYKDTDGERAKDLANALRDTWLRKQLASLVHKVDRELDDIQERIRRNIETRTQLAAELTQFLRQNELNPQDIALGGEGRHSRLTQELLAAKQRATELGDLITDLETRLEVEREALQQEPARTTRQRATALSEELRKALAKVQLQLATASMGLARLNPSHPDYARYKTMRDEAEKQLRQYGALHQEAGVEEVPNPEHRRLKESVADLEAQLEAARAKLAAAEEEHGQLLARSEEMPEVWQRYEQLQERQRELANELDALRGDEMEVLDWRRQLTIEEPYEVLVEANVPPAPTEPNITLVTLAGMAVGLAVAIGLILLIDVLTSTYKTIDDVERMLPVPVLGGLSHMTTLEERRQTVTRRTRAGLLAGAFLVLTLSTVTIYYVAPTRLPPVVRDALHVILGPTSTETQ